jgi:hypothetical protein
VLGAYRESLSAIGAFVDRWGFHKLVRLYVNLGRRGNVPGTARYHLDASLEKIVGVDRKGFESLWASSIGT